MADKFCFYHQDRIAKYQMPSGKSLCDECYQINKAKFPMASPATPVLPKQEIETKIPVPVPAAPVVKEVKWETFQRPRRGQLDPVKRAKVEACLKAGKSTRDTATEVGISNVTVVKVRREIRDQLPANCACGRLTGHKGWCTGRVQKGKARQEVIQRLHDKSSPRSNADFKKPENPLNLRIRAEMETLLTELHSQMATLQGKIEACETVIELIAKL
jgi:hypothetical protein